MTRREFAALAGLGIAAPRLGLAQTSSSTPDFTVRISEMNADLGFRHVVKTLAYNGQIPGPLLRMTEGKRVTVDVVNETRTPEMVHWHGFHIPSEVDGAHEEGTPMVQNNDHRLYSFVPQPSGTRWYHTHAMAGHNLLKGTYTGQFGMVVVEPPSDPGRYDLEVPIILHEWDPYFAADHDMDVDYRIFSVNGKMLGAGEPIRVRKSQQVLFRILNASATVFHRLALPGHTFRVVALDGNPVPVVQNVPVLDLAQGERVDAIVEMNMPGVWTFGELDSFQRAAGAGIVVEYAGSQGQPQWTAPPQFVWDYTAFGGREAPLPVDARIPLVIEPGKSGYMWAINGKSYPHTDTFTLRSGGRNRLIFDNRSSMDHPVHLHRHSFELVSFAGKPSSGIRKDVLIVPARSTVEVDVMAKNPGPSLFHCHQQFHMDFGFMAVMQYSS
jgi:FtsP/CotA-like multicopper oxidase with cupredoxin domain